MVLIDSSVWIDFFNKPDSVTANEVRGLLRNGLVVTNKIIIAEVLSGAMNRKEYNILKQHFGTLDIYPIDDNDFDQIIELNYLSIRKGYKMPITDWIIAINANKNDSAIFSFDKHFKSIKKFIDIMLYIP